jgi:hypothetical protein
LDTGACGASARSIAATTLTTFRPRSRARRGAEHDMLDLVAVQGAQ